MNAQDELVKKCAQTAKLATEALAWLDAPENRERVGAEHKSMVRALRRDARRARRLSKSAASNMSVSVFGPSQAGKSFLVSVLARPENGHLMADFGPDGGLRDYIREINPEGEGECTGIVTRFTIRRIETPEGFPVCLTLLSQADVLRTLTNSFFMDGDQSEPVPEPTEVASHLNDYRARAGARVAGIDQDDVHDVADYVGTVFGRTAHGAALSGFWEDASEIAPLLSIPDRAGLFSILWGGHEALTQQFIDLAMTLTKLGHPEKVFAKIDAILPRETSIIDVKTLARGKGMNLSVKSPAGPTIDIDRAMLCALTAELVVPMAQQPSQFFSETDLLDFPGARNRFEQPLSQTLADPEAALPELLLRGKVAYLFDRYVENQEITSMLLCVPDSNMETLDLPGLIENWIGATHGATPEIRAQNDCVLFFVLTKFDKHLGDSAAEGGDTTRFERRMQASLIEKFGRAADSWVNRWTPEKPFQNCFWLRNPNYYVDGLIEYDAAKREAAIRPEKTARVAQLRSGCLASENVIRHFSDPAAAWDAALALNDGGISYLTKELTRVCKPDSKLRQITAQLSELNARISRILTPYHVSDDIQERIKESHRRASDVIDDLEAVLANHGFGSMIASLQVSQEDLEGRMARVPSSVRIDNAIGGSVAATEMTPRTPLRPGAPARPARVTQPEETSAQGKFRLLSLEAYQAETAIEVWIDNLNRFRDGENDAGHMSREKSNAHIVSELIHAAQRTELAARIATELAEISFGLSIEKQARPAAIVSAERINRFVTTLGTADLPEDQRPQIEPPEGKKRAVFTARPAKDSIADLPRVPRTSAGDFWTDWVFALEALFVDNAKFSGSHSVNIEQNLRLGNILEGLSG